MFPPWWVLLFAEVSISRSKIDLIPVHRYIRAMIVERTQTGVRIEKRILKTLKGLAEYHDMSVGDLLEGILLHVFEGKTPFGERSLRKIAELRKVYELDLNAAHMHKLVEEAPPKKARKGKR